jgi:hypothetical protein
MAADRDLFLVPVWLMAARAKIETLGFRRGGICPTQSCWVEVKMKKMRKDPINTSHIN